MLRIVETLEFLQHHFAKSGHGDLLMARQLISAASEPLLDPPHAKRPPHERLRSNVGGDYGGAIQLVDGGDAAFGDGAARQMNYAHQIVLMPAS